MITDQQQLHRQYLRSEVWKKKRLEALEFYGCICNRCNEHGTDVHHKTYERVGGGELMEDLEVLCRTCHEAHHAIERATKGFCRKSRDGLRGIDKRALFGLLEPWMMTRLIREFKLGSRGDIFIKINSRPGGLVAQGACKLCGFDYVIGCLNVSQVSINKDDIDTNETESPPRFVFGQSASWIARRSATQR